MNNNPNQRNRRRPDPRGGPPQRPRGRPPQNRGSRNPGNVPPNQNPYYNKTPNGQYPQYPPNVQNGWNGQYPNQQPPYGYYYGAPYSQPQSGAEQEYLRRRQELERRQTEARRQAMRDRERREKQRLRAERERRFKKGLKILGGRLLIFAIILVILCALTGLLFLLFFNHTPDEPDTTDKITYCYGGSETRRTPRAEAIADGVVYICFNDLADYLGMMESGSAEAMKFILPTVDTLPSTAGGDGTEETICFYIDTHNVSINGQVVQLDIPNIIRGTEVWVSSTFLTDYINNLSCQYDAKKSKILISRITDEENSTEETIVYLPVSFKLKSSAAIEVIDEEELGVEDIDS